MWEKSEKKKSDFKALYLRLVIYYKIQQDECMWK